MLKASLSAFDGGLNRSTQHFVLATRDGVLRWNRDFVEVLQRGREEGVVGPLAAWGVFEGDRPSVWEAVIVYLFPGGPVRGTSILQQGVARGWH